LDKKETDKCIDKRTDGQTKMES